jgi:hypothetical protein
MRPYGRTLTQSLRSTLHEFDRIAFTNRFHGAAIAQFRHPFPPGLPVLRSRADGLLHGRPVFFLVGRQLQRGLDYADARIRQGVQVGGTKMPHPYSGRRLRCVGKR